MSSNEFTNIQFSRFHAHGLKRNPIYRDSAIQDEDVEVFGTATSELSAGDITVEIIKRPEKAEWGYDVIAEKALYNASRSTNYQLHDSEETELVYKILALAGVIIKRVDIQQAAQGLDISKIQQRLLLVKENYYKKLLEQILVFTLTEHCKNYLMIL